MVYEDMTYEYILNRMINRVSTQYPNLDIREGSIIFNALASAAIELAIMYTELDNVLDESFVDTASRDYLLIKCKESGINVDAFEASYGVHKGLFDVEVPIGSMWNCDLYNYEVTSYIGMENGYHAYRLICSTEGTTPNNITGDLTPLSEYVDDLTYAELTDCLIEGENESSDDEIRETYYTYISANANDGNVAQYKTWCELYDGIGHSQIIPLWNGSNTVKVSILNSSNGVASQTLVDEFQNYLDPNVEGMGNGVAPIGAFVTVTTATEIPISVSADVKLQAGYTDTSEITDAVENYFRSISYDKLIVAYMNVGATILNVEGVESISNLKINGGTSDVILYTEEIPVLSDSDWTVVG